MLYVWRTLCQLFLGRFHQDGGEKTGWSDEGRCELSQPLLSEPLQGRLQTSSHRYERFQLHTACVCLYSSCLKNSVWLDFLPLPKDLMMGLPVTEDLYSIFSKEKEHEEKEKESQRGAQEQVSLLLQTYMQLLLPDDEKFHGGWALINCDMRLADTFLSKYLCVNLIQQIHLL